ncbi:MAG: hypothetical protein MZW92_36685 [Comamonadaceae bacterium]|nr:hypothetical protein [Comamonadaceae bacterium]
MAENESFFRKVVRFVANPATDWTELNSRQEDTRETRAREVRAQGDDRAQAAQRLRAQARVRHAAPACAAKACRPSSWRRWAARRSSTIPRPGCPTAARARTDGGVKAKIDEIEQQMVGDGRLRRQHARRPRRLSSAPDRSAAPLPRRRQRAAERRRRRRRSACRRRRAACRRCRRCPTSTLPPRAAAARAGADGRPACRRWRRSPLLDGARTAAGAQRLRQPVRGRGQRGGARPRTRRGRDRLRQRRLRAVRAGAAAHHRRRRRARAARRDLAGAVRPVPRHRPAAALREPGAGLCAAVRLVGAAVVLAAQAGGRRGRPRSRPASRARVARRRRLGLPRTCWTSTPWRGCARRRCRCRCPGSSTGARCARIDAEAAMQLSALFRLWAGAGAGDALARRRPPVPRCCRKPRPPACATPTRPSG